MDPKKRAGNISWKAIGRWLLWPPVWLTVLLCIGSGAALIFIFLNGMEEHPFAYAAYLLAAWALTAATAHLVPVIPGWCRAVSRRAHRQPFLDRYLTDRVCRTQVDLHVSLAVNLAFSLFKLTAGFLYASFWMGAVAIYYACLSLMRFLLLRSIRQGSRSLLDEYRRYRLIGWLMLILSISLAGIVFFMVWWGRGYNYPGYLIFVVAAWTFYSAAVSVRDLIRYRKLDSPVVSAAKAIRFAAALVSILTMETAMLARFGDDPSFSALMTALTGAGVYIITLGISAWMLIRSGKEIRKLEGEK